MTPLQTPPASNPQDATYDFSFASSGEPATSNQFLAADPGMLRIRELAQRVAPTPATVLITGESGAGKEVLARFIHQESRRSGPFVKVNCSAVPRDLLESELFGHERGAFAGANQTKKGRFELAGEGTIVLDEISEMDLSLQAKLLQVLEESTVTRVGGSDQLPFEARVLATTDRPLEQAIASSDFRRDLYYRLKVIQIDIPPLRERRDDIRLLARHFLDRFSDHQNRTVTSFTPRVEQALLDYSWPGNVRELKHVVMQYVILPDDDMLLSELASNEALHRQSGFRRRSSSGMERNGSSRGGFSSGWSGSPRNGNGSYDGNGNGNYDGNGNGHGNGFAPWPSQPAPAPSPAFAEGGNGQSYGSSGNDRSGFAALSLPDHEFLEEHFWADRRGLHLERDYEGQIPLKAIAAMAAEEAEKQVILAVLEETRWNRKEAASRLDICYKTLLNKLDRWDLGARSGSDEEE